MLDFNFIKISVLFDFDSNIKESLKGRPLIVASLLRDIANTSKISGFPCEFKSDKKDLCEKIKESMPLNNYDQVG